jgi:Meiotically Up-regulated Gene 113 (MUG113) protein
MRDKILSDIKRLAEANGGTPLGREAFEKETGYRTGNWLGKYWARWSDAVADAGLTAQEFRRKQDTAQIYPKLAEALRHYKRVPTKPELQLYRKLNPEFPWHNTLETHFGSKSNMYESLRKWAMATEGYDDVAAMISEVPIPEKDPGKAVSEGFVYLIKSGAFYKIGRGDELEKRVKQIRVALPDASKLEHSIRTDDPAGIEAYWHRRFADKRGNGEWFKLSPSDVAAFKRRKYQ